ncbi:MAG: hypothetical protein QOG62_1752 [Thermoleophilaceae bacterium]|nr:hypothetical protein [Thermoleophilaceae bacterium]
MAVVAAGALRVAGALAAGPLERIVSAAPIGVAFAMISALGLGLFGLGSQPLLLTGVAVVAWITARLLIPDPGTPLRALAIEALRQMGTRGHSVIGVLVAVAGVAIVYALAQPVTGIDAAHYSLPESLAWVLSGHPGSVVPVEPVVPVGYQPLAHEVLFGWLLAIARSFTPLPFPSIALLGLLGAAGWLGLRRLDVPRMAAGLAVAMLLTMPLLLGVATWPKNDIAVLAWLAAAGALFACARRTPALAGPALVALGLALGTKSTALVPVFFLAVIGLWQVRSRLVEARGAIGAGLLAGLAVSAPWYIRDLIDNGSPVWPYLALPGGRPTIPYVAEASSFLEQPIETLRSTASLNVFFVGPAPILVIVAAAGCALLTRSRAVVGATLVAAIGLVAWALAPFTGVAPGDTIIEIWGAAANVRYALPALAVALLAVALAARGQGLAGRVASWMLGLAVAANVVTLGLFALHSQGVLLAPLSWVVVAVLLGTGAGLLAARIPPARILSIPVFAAAALLVIAAMVVAAPGYPQRHETIGLIAPPELMRFLEADPRWRSGDGVVAMGPQLFAPAAGARLQHPLALVTPATLCSYVADAPQGWLALTSFSQAPDEFAAEREHCLGHTTPALDTPGLKIYTLPVR